MSDTPTTSKRIRSPILTSPARKKAFLTANTRLGASSFRVLVEESTIFIDKSFFIKEFIESNAQVLLITYPRRWGKSINMDMIKTFFEIEVDSAGNKYADKTQTNNYKLFQGITSKDVYLEKPLNIAQETNIMQNYQGEYPVIFVNFKNVKGTSYEAIINKVKLAISETFQQHEYLYKRLLIQEIDEHNQICGTSFITQNQSITYLERVINVNKIELSNKVMQFKILYDNKGQRASDIDIEDSIKFLSELLHNHFGKRAYILIDEYDTPINNILKSEKLSNEDIENTLMLFRSLLGTAFKDNIYLEKGFITGIFRIAKSSLYSDLNNLTEYNFLFNKFAQYYGFTEDDTENLFTAYKISKEDQHKAQNWYDGYRIALEPTLKLYNPWSIIQFLNHNKIQNYWEESGSIDFIKNLFKINAIRSKISLLLNQENIDEESNELLMVQLDNLKFSKEDYLTLKDLINKGDNFQIHYDAVELFFRFIFAAGYLTVTENQKSGTLTSVKIPNKEVKSEMEKKLIFYYQKIYTIDNKLFIDVTNELEKLFYNNKDTNNLKLSLEALFNGFPKFVNIKKGDEEGVHGNEDLIHSAINYSVLQIKNLTQFGTEIWNSKEGRADIILNNQNVKTGMIIELKYGKSADQALIQSQKYTQILTKQTNIEIIIYLGISVFPDKAVDIRYKQLQITS